MKLKTKNISETKELPTIAIILFCLVSIIAGTSGYFVYKEATINNPYLRTTTAIVTETTKQYDAYYDKYEYQIYIDYEVNNSKYTHIKLPYYVASLKEGMEITITYDERNPQVVHGDLKLIEYMSYTIFSFAFCFFLLALWQIILKIKIKIANRNKYDIL